MPNRSILYATEPDWIKNRPGLHHRIPISVQSWVYEPDSLTQRLRSIYGPTVTVKILFHQWKKPFLSERRLLQLPHNRYSLIREVVLSTGNTPLIIARTVIPARTLRGTQRILSSLGNRPLGEVIFAYPKLQRLEMDLTCIKPDNWSTQLTGIIPIHQKLWGRRTVYAVQHRQLLVTEYFLPTLFYNC